MSSNNEQTQEQKATALLNKMLSEINARDLRTNLNELFYGFLDSEKANSKSFRNRIGLTHSILVEYFTKLSNLPEVDRFDR